MMSGKPEPQHDWLKQLVGEWTYEADCPNPDGPPLKMTGSESVRMFGEVWMIAHGKGTAPDGTPTEMQLSLGYDPPKSKFIGTWIGTMMTTLWTYEGTLDASKKILTLETTGPSWTEEGATANYREVITLVSPNERTFESSVQGKDGSWTSMMKMTYRRAK